MACKPTKKNEFREVVELKISGDYRSNGICVGIVEGMAVKWGVERHIWLLPSLGNEIFRGTFRVKGRH